MRRRIFGRELKIEGGEADLRAGRLGRPGGLEPLCYSESALRLRLVLVGSRVFLIGFATILG
jgi:hypothetical protein